MSIGPKITIRRSCADCAVCQGERYTCQSDSGTDVYCAHPSFPQRRIIGDSRWDTPQWCPAEPEIAARADARITELERECSQWRDELRIYRETDGARIAELEAALRRVRRWCMGSGYSASVQVAMKEWIDGGMVGGMPELTGLDAAIDAACVNGGGM